MERTYIKNLHEQIGKEVSVSGFVNVRRDHGKLIFIDLRDMTGVVQMVVLPNHKDAHTVAGDIRQEWVVRINGVVNKRPEKMINADEANGDIEIEVVGMEVLSQAAELPFDTDGEINIDTYLNYLPLTLRDKKKRAIFKVQGEIVEAFREFFRSKNFTEVQVPKIIGEDAEGGANSFSFDYFGNTAHLAQSPQFYKQIMVGVYERVFTTGNVYRAEKHSTTRHLNEYTGLDAEMGFIADHTDVMKILGDTLRYISKKLKEETVDEFGVLGAEYPLVPDTIPKYTLREAQEIIKKEHGEDCANEPDLEPQHERWLCEYAKEKHNSDAVFVTHYPVEKRAMYTHEDENDPGYTKDFDLLFRGVEIATGGQRIHDYDTLVKSMEKRDLDPEKFRYYLQAFKFGMPPHGGFGMGLERLTEKFLGLSNVKEATLFPRDMNRIDNLLSE